MQLGGTCYFFIHKYLLCGVMLGDYHEDRVQGIVQESPLSPLLSNVGHRVGISRS